jgi:hypothetical protein
MYCSEPSPAFLQPRLDIPELTNRLPMAHVEVATEGSEFDTNITKQRNAFMNIKAGKVSLETRGFSGALGEHGPMDLSHRSTP